MALIDGVIPDTKFPSAEIRHSKFADLDLDRIVQAPFVAQLTKASHCFSAEERELFYFHLFPMVCQTLDATRGDAVVQFVVDAAWDMLTCAETMAWEQASARLKGQLQACEASAVYMLLPYPPPLSRTNFHSMAKEQLDRFLQSEIVKENQRNDLVPIRETQILPSQSKMTETRKFLEGCPRNESSDASDNDRTKSSANISELHSFGALSSTQEGYNTPVLDALVPHSIRSKNLSRPLGQVLNAITGKVYLYKSKVLMGRTGEGFRIHYSPSSTDISGITKRLGELGSETDYVQRIERLLRPFAQWNPEIGISSVKNAEDVGEAGIHAYTSRWLRDPWKLLLGGLIPMRRENEKHVVSTVTGVIRAQCEELAKHASGYSEQSVYDLVTSIGDHFYAKLAHCFIGSARASGYYED